MNDKLAFVHAVENRSTALVRGCTVRETLSAGRHRFWVSLAGGLVAMWRRLGADTRRVSTCCVGSLLHGTFRAGFGSTMFQAVALSTVPAARSFSQEVIWCHVVASALVCGCHTSSVHGDSTWSAASASRAAANCSSADLETWTPRLLHRVQFSSSPLERVVSLEPIDGAPRDGSPSTLVGIRRTHSNDGAVALLRLKSGAIAYKVHAPSLIDRNIRFPADCVAIGDVDGDLSADFIVLTGQQDLVNEWPPIVVGYSGLGGRQLYETQIVQSGEFQSRPLAAAIRDLDGDGLGDFAILGVADASRRLATDMQVAFYSSRDGSRIARHGINVKMSDAMPIAFTLANRGRAAELDVLEKGRFGSGEAYWIRRYDVASGNCLASRLLLEQDRESVSAARMATRFMARGWDAAVVTCSRTLDEAQSLRVLRRHGESGSESVQMIKVPEEIGGVTGLQCCFLAGNAGDDYQGIAIALTGPSGGRVVILSFSNGAAHWLPVLFSTDGVSILTVAAECISDESGDSIALIVGEPGSGADAGAVHVYELRQAR